VSAACAPDVVQAHATLGLDDALRRLLATMSAEEVRRLGCDGLARRRLAAAPRVIVEHVEVEDLPATYTKGR
jgi:hypothetical protein